MGCQHCENEEIIFEDNQMYIRKGTDELRMVCIDGLERGYMGCVPINYCPMCGRKLGDTNE